MSKIKVYLAKSNLCDPDDITMVRNLLKDDNIELLEYRGGEYTDDDLLKADYMVVLPYHNSWHIKGGNWKCFVGAGVYKQMVTFGKYEKIFFINDVEDFTYARIQSVEIYNQRDYKTEHGLVTVMGPHMDLRDTDIFKSKPIEPKTNTNTNRRLLICKPTIV